MQNLHESTNENEFLESLTEGTVDDNIRVLTCSRLAKLIEKSFDGGLSISELSQISNLLELSDNVIYELGHEQKIADTLFALSSPEINSNLTLQKLETLRNELLKVVDS